MEKNCNFLKIMQIKSSDFITSSNNYKNCPKPDKAEFAFIGRSNVGKSSLINMLAGRRKLAKTSATPGKTQLINHFLINNHWYLVDLPGYGWAKVSKKEKMKWEGMIRNYLLKRENLLSIFVLVDIRHDPQKIDLDLINWLGEENLPFTIVFTKVDKLSKNKAHATVAKFRKTLSSTWEELPKMIISSATTGLGKEDILQYIDHVLGEVSF